MSQAAAAIAFGNVFPGLRPFRPDEDHLFFGRESQIDTMVDVLAKSRLLAVVGSSGSGKSSLVNCGLRPALHRGLMAVAGTGWRVAQFRPGDKPIESLTRALANDGVLHCGYQGAVPLEEVLDTSLRVSKRGLLDVYRRARLPEQANLLVIVDQFEELFRYRTQDTSVRTSQQSLEQAVAFVNLLLEAKRSDLPIYIVLTMRSDFLGNCAEFQGLPEAINQGQYLVPRMSRDERRAAIKGPIGVGGAKISPVLLSRLVNDVGDNPDQLSILQHALNRTWAHWKNQGHCKGPITIEHYEAIGTMAEALDRHAEKAFAELTSDRQRKICEKTFKALTDKGTDVRGIRRPASLETLCLISEASMEEVTAVIEVFRKPSRSFLMPELPASLHSYSIIDISHESLMRVWSRLRTWADEEAQSAQLYRRLSESATLHAEGRAALWRDPELQLALDWRTRVEPTVAWARFYGGGFQQAMMFLAHSEALRQQESQEREEHGKRKADYEKALALGQEQQLRIALQAKATARLRVLLTLLVFLFGAAAAASIWAVKQERKAEGLQRESKARELAAVALSELKEDPERSVLLAAQAVNATLRFGQPPVPVAEDALQMALLFLPENLKLKHSAPVLAVAYSRDRKIATGSTDGVARVWNASDGKLLLSMSGATGPLTSVTFSPDGKAVATAGEDGTVRLWNAVTGEAQLAFQPRSGALTSLTYSPDGGQLLVGSSTNSATVWDATNGTLLRTLRGHSEAVTSVAFSTDGTLLMTGSSDRTAKIWNRGNGQVIATLRGHSEPVTAVAISPNSKFLATGSTDGTVRIWNARSAVQVRNLRHSGPLKSLQFSPDGKWLATGTSDETVYIWDADKSVQVLTLRVLGTANAVAFSPNGKQLATASSNDVAQVWDLSAGKGLLAVHHEDSVNDLTFSPDGRKLATASSDKTAKIWDSKTGDELLMLAGPAAPVNSVSYSKDGRRVATVAADGSLTVWDASSGKHLLTMRGHEGAINGVAYSPNNKKLATAGADGTARLWDAISGGEALLKLQHAGPVNFVTFSPDGERVATASSDGTAKLWSVSGGQALITLKHGGGVLDVAFSPDGKRIMTAGADGDISIWYAQTGKLLKVLHGHSSSILAIVSSPDNVHFATASQDGTAKVWDSRTGRAVETLSSKSGAVNSVAYSPDGRRLAAASTDGTAQVYTLDIMELLKLARSRTSRELSAEECLHYLQLNPCPSMP